MVSKDFTLTQDYLKEILSYNPETGVFTWKKRISIRISVGAVAGTINDGYIIIGIKGKASESQNK